MNRKETLVPHPIKGRKPGYFLIGKFCLGEMPHLAIFSVLSRHLWAHPDNKVLLRMFLCKGREQDYKILSYKTAQNGFQVENAAKVINSK